MKAEVSAVAREWLEARDSVAELIDSPPGSERVAKELADRATRILAAAAFVGAAPKGNTGRWLSGVAEGPMKLVLAAGEVLLMASASDPDGEWTDDFPGPQVREALALLDDRRQEMEDRLAPDLDKLERGEQDPLRKKIARSLNPEETPPEDELQPAEKAIRNAWHGLEYEKAVPAESWEVAREGWERFFVDNVEDLLASAGQRPERILAAAAALLAYARGNAAGFEDALEQLLAGQTVDESDEEGEADEDSGFLLGADDLVREVDKLRNFLATLDARESRDLIRRQVPLNIFVSSPSADTTFTIDPKKAALWYAEALHEMGIAQPPKLIEGAGSLVKLIEKLNAFPPLEEGKVPEGTDDEEIIAGNFVVDLSDFQWEAVVMAGGQRLQNADAHSGQEGSEGVSEAKLDVATKFARELWDHRAEVNVTFFDRKGLAERLVSKLVPAFEFGTRGVVNLKRLSEDQVAALVQQAFADSQYEIDRGLARNAGRSILNSGSGPLTLDERVTKLVDRVVVEHGDRVMVGNGDAIPGAGNPLQENELRTVSSADLAVALQERDPERANRALEELDSMIGLTAVKAQIEMIRKVVEANQQARAMGMPDASLNLNFVLLGGPGTGKTTVAMLLGEILAGLGAISSGHLVARSPGELMGGHLGSASGLVNGAIEEAMGGVLLIDEAYDFQGRDDDYGPKAVNALVNKLDREEVQRDLVVVLCGYGDRMENLWKMNPGLPSRFPDQFRIELPPYSDDDLLDIFLSLLSKEGLVFDDEFVAAAEQELARIRNSTSGDFAGARGVRDLFERTHGAQRVRVFEAGAPEDEEFKRQLAVEDLESDQPRTLQLNSVPGTAATGGESGSNGSGQSRSEESESDRRQRRFIEAKEKLDALIGLSEVKAKIGEIADTVIYELKLQEAGLLPEESSGSGGGNHMVFTGNPGTGKTTVANLTAEMLTAIGIVSDRKVVTVTATSLVSEYQAKSGSMTSRLIRENLGKVLFIDEAYALSLRASDSSGHNTGQEAISELVALMDEFRHQIVVIVAGYTEEMNEFLAANSGLRGRFRHFVEFPDYDSEELTEIAVKIAADAGYSFTPDAEKKVKRLFEELKTDNGFSNGRTARDVVDELKAAVTQRNLETVSQSETGDLEEQKETLLSIEAEDVSTVEKSLRGRRELDGEALKELLEETDAELGELELPGSVKREIMGLLKRAARQAAGDQLADPALDLIFVADEHQKDRTVGLVKRLAGFLDKTGKLRSPEVVEFEVDSFRDSDSELTADRIGERIEQAIGRTLLVHDAHLLSPAALGKISGSLSEKDLISIILRVPDQKCLNELRRQDPDLERGMESAPINMNHAESGGGTDSDV